MTKTRQEKNIWFEFIFVVLVSETRVKTKYHWTEDVDLSVYKGVRVRISG